MTATTDSAAVALNGSVPAAAARPAVADHVPVGARRRWFGLVVIALSQLMIVVDATIVNVALPAMTTTLRISPADRQWVVTVYTLAFGGLLLIGGRIADYLGLRRAFVIGLLGFGVASALGGAAQNLSTLLTARAMQGAFGALLAPAALALLATTFHDARERAKAFAIFGAVAGGGSAIGLILGGILTEYASWRWTMFINVPIALLTVAGAYALLDEHRGEHPGRLDIVGTLLATGGLLSLVYSFSEAQRHGWTRPLTLTLIYVGLSLLVGFVISQRMVGNPVLPLRVLANRTRAGANVAVALASVALFGAFFFLTFFMQGVLHYSPVKTGVGFLAVTGGIIVASGVVSAIGARVRPRLIMGAGLLGAATGMALLMRIGVGSTYAPDILPALVLIGLSLGCVFVPSFNAATIGVAPRDASIASATINTAQQVGGSLGVALLSTVAANRAGSWLADHGVDPGNLIQAQVAGYVRASLWGAVILAVAAALTAWLVDIRRLDLSPHAEAVGLPTARLEPAIHVEPAPSTVRATGPDATMSDVPTPPRRPEHRSDSGWAALGAPGARPLIGPTAPGRPSGRAAADGRPSPADRVAAVGVAATCVVRDRSGATLAGANWTVLDTIGGQLANGDADALGRFSFAAPGHPEVVLVVRSAGYRPFVRGVRAEAGPLEIDVAMVAGLLVHGVVRSVDGGAVPDARVRLLDRAGAVVSQTGTDAEGRYELADVPAGDYTLVAAGYPPATTNVTVSQGGDVEAALTLAHTEQTEIAQ